MRHVIIIRFANGHWRFVLAACQDMDPYTRTDMWQPTGANAGNIAAMVANPYDLIRGRGVPIVDTKESTIAIGHLWTDTPKPLLGAGGAPVAAASVADPLAAVAPAARVAVADPAVFRHQGAEMPDDGGNKIQA